MNTWQVTGEDVRRAQDAVAAAEAQIVVDGLTGATAETLADARAAEAVAESGVRLHERSIVLHR